VIKKNSSSQCFPRTKDDELKILVWYLCCGHQMLRPLGELLSLSVKKSKSRK
jgi:hypothetical protein